MTSHANHRRGAETLELILVLPVLFTVLIAGIQFSSVIVVDTTLAHASIEAARLAAMGCDAAEIAARTDQFLSAHGMVLGTGSRLVIEDETGVIQSHGDGLLTSSIIGTPVAPDSVRSTFLVETDASPIPNLLKSDRIDFSGKLFQQVAVASIPRCECP